MLVGTDVHGHMVFVWEETEVPRGHQPVQLDYVTIRYIKCYHRYNIPFHSMEGLSVYYPLSSFP